MKSEKMQAEVVGQDAALKSRTLASHGCLLIHGYGGSPFEMEGLEAVLRKAGFAVRNTCLPGHAEEDADFAAKRFHEWLAHVEREYEILAAHCSAVSLVGFSLGGTLALNLAARRPVFAVVCLATPLYVMSFLPWPIEHLAFYARFIKAQAHRVLTGTMPDKTASRAIAPWKGYARPLHFTQLLHFRIGCAQTRRLLPRITAPILVMHDRADKLVYSGNATEIIHRVSSPSTTLRLTAIRETVTKHHMLTTHQETRGFIESEVERFMREKCLEY